MPAKCAITGTSYKRVKKRSKSMQSTITKVKPKLSTTGATSDLRFIRKLSPGLEFGLVGKTMHKVDEAVSLNDLKKLTKIYSQILDNYFS